MSTQSTLDAVTPPRLVELCCRSFCHSVCEQDNSRTRRQTSTKRGRRGQKVTLSKSLIFVADPDLDVDVGAVFDFLNSGRYEMCDILSLTRGRRCSGYMRHLIRHSDFSHHKATMKRPWRRLRCLSAV